jgi:hypothetical protein
MCFILSLLGSYQLEFWQTYACDFGPLKKNPDSTKIECFVKKINNSGVYVPVLIVWNGPETVEKKIHCCAQKKRFGTSGVLYAGSSGI